MTRLNRSISVVSPVYKGEKQVAELVSRVKNTLKTCTDEFEIILVEDGSTEESWNAVKREAEKDSCVKAIKLSRNFGQHKAIFAGLSFCRKDWIVVMDCDLQDLPEEIPSLLNASEGVDVVLAQRINRRDGYLKKTFSSGFYKVFGYLSNTKQDPTVANFGLYNLKVIKAILTYGDYIKYFPIFVQSAGFKTKKVEIRHGERLSGKTNYSFGKLLQLSLDVILSFSNKPLLLVMRFGLLISLMSVVAIAVSLHKYLVHDIIVPGYTSIIISICLFSGIIIFLIGFIGMYIGRIFDQVKNRPAFIIEHALNVDVND